MRKDNKIKKELDTVFHGETHPEWRVAGRLLSKIQVSKYWSPEYSSFSTWLNVWGKESGMGRATLWRYVSASKKYGILRTHGKDHGYDFPMLKDVEQPISPESIEILFNIYRVIEEGQAFKIMQDVIDGKVRRKELREKWQIYKPILRGRTGRGLKEITSLKADIEHSGHSQLIKALAILDNVRMLVATWLCSDTPALINFYQNVKLDLDPKSGMTFDAVFALKEDQFTPLCIHGLEVVGKKIPSKRAIESYSKYFHCIWFAVSDEYAEENRALASAGGAGLLSVSDDTVKVFVSAKRSVNHKFLNETLQELLIR